MGDAHRRRSPTDEATAQAGPSLTVPVRRRILLVDGVLAAVIGLMEFAVMQHIYVLEELTMDSGEFSVVWWPYLLMWATSYGALAFRRIRPLLVFVVTSGCLLVATLLQDVGPDELLPIAFWISLFTLVRRQRLGPSLATLAGALAVGVVQAYLVVESPVSELLGRDSWVSPDPWYSHLELVWLTAGIYLMALCPRLVAAVRHRAVRLR
ncbi:MAG TPA: hypothetical protein VIT65_27570 [Microlunatus sp.]